MLCMTSPPTLFDRTALARNRARAAKRPELFLQELMAREVEERLTEVNRTFTSPAVVTPWPTLWNDALPSAKVIPDQDTLPLEEGAHDLVVHGLCLHWANDPVGQLIQCKHALKPDGLMIATLFGGNTLAELRAALATAESRIVGGLSPRIAPMGDIRDLGVLLQRAGFSLPVADTSPLTITYESTVALMQDLRAMGETNALAGRTRKATTRAIFAEAAKIYAESYGLPDGRIPATFEIVTLTAWAPAPDQPQPLRPGSATTRLADAIGAIETTLPERGN